MIKVISFKICPFVQRVTALLEAKQAPYEIQYIDLSNKPEWFLEISPNGQVPLLITESNDVLFESDAIVEYIDEAIATPLFDSDLVKKAQERSWSYLATKHYLVQCSAQRSKDKGTLLDRSHKLSKAFAKLESKLTNEKFFGGDQLDMVDIAWLPLLHRASIIEQHSGYDFIGQFPKVKALQKQLLATGLAEKSVSEDFEEKFAAFYLSEQTYLGQCAKTQLGKTCFGESDCRDEDFDCCS
ncbi:Glutathione S-transferase domain protein [[Leptolyngbya] sp. PCC 7376]|uniref:glutathione S-transferase family protein n=1 Tax=[Leptolyngbya] sp. PCC 7376 TaxID=111781 RepID=UPI00029F0D21|nr:glutathione S-transferase family protein [[Leptolyngbya] sp. PCC 7376]AFY37882.1 Glutathione S-transferase domain protein [[Leptolyngbya] sp. PCC 7376]